MTKHAMSLFEDYKHRKLTDPKSTLPADLVIRPAIPDNTDQPAKIAYDRDGGEFIQLENRFKHEITNLESTDDGLLHVAEWKSGIIGFARVKYFKPASSAPADTCPEGWYLTGINCSSRIPTARNCSLTYTSALGLDRQTGRASVLFRQRPKQSINRIAWTIRFCRTNA